MRRALALLSLAPAVLVAGCGNDRTEPPDLKRPRPATAFVTARYPAAGVSFAVPKDWTVTPGRAPLLATFTAGRVTVAAWRYPRTEPLPRTPAELRAARDALVAAAKARDPSFTVTKAKGTRAAHHPAVVIVADETVAGQPRTVRSTHVYAAGGEVVIDAFAPPADYAKVEGPVFRRVVRTLRIAKPAA